MTESPDYQPRHGARDNPRPFTLLYGNRVMVVGALDSVLEDGVWVVQFPEEAPSCATAAT